jgi:hypothetical protein
LGEVDFLVAIPWSKLRKRDEFCRFDWKGFPVKELDAEKSSGRSF